MQVSVFPASTRRAAGCGTQQQQQQQQQQLFSPTSTKSQSNNRHVHTPWQYSGFVLSYEETISATARDSIKINKAPSKCNIFLTALAYQVSPSTTPSCATSIDTAWFSRETPLSWPCGLPQMIGSCFVYDVSKGQHACQLSRLVRWCLLLSVFASMCQAIPELLAATCVGRARLGICNT